MKMKVLLGLCLKGWNKNIKLKNAGGVRENE